MGRRAALVWKLPLPLPIGFSILESVFYPFYAWAFPHTHFFHFSFLVAWCPPAETTAQIPAGLQGSSGGIGVLNNLRWLVLPSLTALALSSSHLAASSAGKLVLLFCRKPHLGFVLTYPGSQHLHFSGTAGARSNVPGDDGGVQLFCLFPNGSSCGLLWGQPGSD